jgi:hypothetical protein
MDPKIKEELDFIRDRYEKLSPEKREQYDDPTREIFRGDRFNLKDLDEYMHEIDDAVGKGEPQPAITDILRGEIFGRSIRDMFRNMPPLNIPNVPLEAGREGL